MGMELICSKQETVDSQVKEAQKLCSEHNIDLVVRQVNDNVDLKSLDLNDKTWTILLLDNVLSDLIEDCGKIVSKIIKMTSVPNKLIFLKQVDDDRFKELMEMFETSTYRSKTIVNTFDQVIQIISKKRPSESDDISLQTTNLETVEPLSATSMMNDQKSNLISRRAAEPLESHHSFSSDDEGIKHMNGLERVCLQKSSSEQTLSPGSPDHELDFKNKEVKSLPSHFQSVATNQLYPSLPTNSVMTSYLRAGMESVNLGPNRPEVTTMQPGTNIPEMMQPGIESTQPETNRLGLESMQLGSLRQGIGTMQSGFHGQGMGTMEPCINRPSLLSFQSYDSAGPQGMYCQSGHDCPCSVCLPQHSASFQQTSQLKNQPAPMNQLNFRPEILDMNRRLAQPYHPNIQSVGSDNRAVSCSNCGHSVTPKQRHINQLDVGPSSETFHSAGAASGMTEKEYPMNEDKLSVMDLKEDVMVMIRDSLDCAEYYNWRKLADLHKWSFGKINQLEQKWKSRKIDSPFMYLIQEFQHYTLMDLKSDLEQIPRKDLLHNLEEYQRKGLLFHN